MQANSQRDPKKFAQRTLAAAIAASTMATFPTAALAQTTGGGIGAAVDGNANASAGVANQGTSGTAGGTTTSGVAAPNAPSSPVRPGSGPGINNTGSPVLAVPPNLQPPVGGSTGPRNPNGTSRIPGNTVPPPMRNQPVTNGLNGANVPQPTGPASGITPPLDQNLPNGPGSGPTTTRRPAGFQRTGTITNFTDSMISFREGTGTSQLNLTPNTVVQMNGRNITLRDIPPAAQVRIERSPSNPNQVQRIVVLPQGGAGNQPGSVNMQTGTGSTGSANRSLPNGNDLNAATPNASTPNNDINAATANPSTPNNDINAGTANASTPGNDLNSPVINNANPSDRPLAPGQNPADPPLAPFTRGNEQRLQAGFDERQSQPNANQPGGQPTGPATDSSEFLGPVSGDQARPGDRSTGQRRGAGRNAGANVTPPNNRPTIGGDPRVNDAPRDGGPGYVRWDGGLNQRMGMQLTAARDGLTVGEVGPQSVAARSGLQAGDRIQSINGQSVSTPDAFAQALQSPGAQGPFSARVIREGTPRDLSFSIPNGFFNGLNVGGVPAVDVGGGIGIAADGTPGVNAGGIFVPATGDVQVGAGQAGAGRGVAGSAPTAGMDRAASEPTLGRNRPVDVPVATQRTPLTTEALKVPEVDLGWQLKATPEGVVMSSLVDDGLAAQSDLQSGDLIESIDGRPITAPGAVAYELHRHRAGATIDVSILRGGKRLIRQIQLPDSHQPLLLNRSETFGAANNAAKEQGGSSERPVPVKPTEESRKTLEEENRALREQIEELRQQQKP